MSNMKINKVVPDNKGIQELMKCQGIQDLLLEEANGVVSRCEGSYETNIYVGKTRANASIITRDYATYYKNLKDNELIKALGL